MIVEKSKMPTTTTVVTPVRFDQGLTYVDFLAGAIVNRDKFENNYKTAPLRKRIWRSSGGLPL